MSSRAAAVTVRQAASSIAIVSSLENVLMPLIIHQEAARKRRGSIFSFGLIHPRGGGLISTRHEGIEIGRRAADLNRNRASVR